MELFARSPSRARGGPSAHLSQSRAVTAPRSPGAAGFLRSSSQSQACSNHCRPDSDRPESGHGRGISACLDVHHVGLSAPGGGGDVPTKGYTYYHALTRRSGTLSSSHHTRASTVATHEPIINMLQHATGTQRAVATPRPMPPASRPGAPAAGAPPARSTATSATPSPRMPAARVGPYRPSHCAPGRRAPTSPAQWSSPPTG
jgi:hypothetical protein